MLLSESNSARKEEECGPPTLSRDSSICPSNGIGNQDGQELTLGLSVARRAPTGQSLARGTPNDVRGESCGVVQPCSPSPARVAGVDQPDMPCLLPLDEDEEEVEEGRPAHTRKPPCGMTASEMRTHALTHIPFHPGCRSCVAGRMRDHHHPRRSGVQEMQDELDSANAHLSADSVLPTDAPGHKGVTAIALRDRSTKLLTGHVVEQERGTRVRSTSCLNN